MKIELYIDNTPVTWDSLQVGETFCFATEARVPLCIKVSERSFRFIFFNHVIENYKPGSMPFYRVSSDLYGATKIDAK